MPAPSTMMPRNVGAHSPKLDEVRALRLKAGRRQQRRFATEGPTMLAEALDAKVQPEAVYVTERAYAALGALGAAVEDRLFVIPERAMARLSELESPPGLLAVFPWAVAPLETVLGAGRSALVLAGIADPGNAGTLLRSAEIFGIESVVFVGDGVEPYNPKLVRATMGATFRLRLAVASGGELTRAGADGGYALVAAGRDGVPLTEFRFPARVLIAIGNERRGVADSLPSWDWEVAIPQRGSGESLNAAVAGSIILYAFSQQASATITRPETFEKP